jgi:glucans biosynthesis protein
VGKETTTVAARTLRTDVMSLEASDRFQRRALGYILSILLCASCHSSSGHGDTSISRPKLAAAGAEKPHAHEQTALPAHFARLIERARTLAQADHVPPTLMELPAALRELDYDAYRSIRFRPEQSLWRGEPGEFEAQFFHPGFYYREPVAVHVIERDGTLHQLAFSRDLFSYGDAPPPAPEDKLGFTGLRLHAPLNTGEYRDEVIVFQGASYFRSLGRGQVYGLSARGLAIDTGEPTGEEFPRFSELYLVRPGEGQKFVWLLGLLESPRATGAYAFKLTPEQTTTVEVHARVFLRERVGVLGLAPLTSMFLFGEDAPNRFGDFRPEVHDSDGLMMTSKDGEQLFRPLRNPERTTVCTFRLDSPRGFGLVQRDRAFSSYQDLEARYQDRPSAWVEPLGDWGKGSVRLLEIATPKETDDNIAVLWVPDHVPADGLTIDYRLHFGADPPAEGKPARTVSTRVARGEKGQVRFVVEFAGDALREAGAPVTAQISVSGGKLVEQHTEANAFTSGVRASFEVLPEGPDVELRAFLKAGDRVLSETWSYLWQPTPSQR